MHFGFKRSAATYPRVRALRRESSCHLVDDHSNHGSSFPATVSCTSNHALTSLPRIYESVDEFHRDLQYVINFSYHYLRDKRSPTPPYPARSGPASETSRLVSPSGGVVDAAEGSHLHPGSYAIGRLPTEDAFPFRHPLPFSFKVIGNG